MDLLQVIVALVVVGTLMFVINRWWPMDADIKQILNVAVICFLVLWLLQTFGILDYVRTIRIGR